MEDMNFRTRSIHLHILPEIWLRECTLWRSLCSTSTIKWWIICEWLPVMEQCGILLHGCDMKRVLGCFVGGGVVMWSLGDHDCFRVYHGWCLFIALQQLFHWPCIHSAIISLSFLIFGSSFYNKILQACWLGVYIHAKLTLGTWPT